MQQRHSARPPLLSRNPQPNRTRLAPLPRHRRHSPQPAPASHRNPATFAPPPNPPAPASPPRFDTLDTDLQSHLYSFLWSRGVDRDFVGYLFTAVVDKEQREYVRWLQNMHEFVAKKQ